jgi:RNA-directed DNA polymerase
MRLIRKDSIKRIFYIYEKIYDRENIRLAIRKASLGKRDKSYVKRILNNEDKVIDKIQEMLKNKTYQPSPYTIKNIKDGASGKEREIFMPRFYPDQIIHWALMLQVEPVFMRGMYKYNCGSVPGRGSSFGQKAIRKWLDTDYKGTKYCLKMDVKKFYPSVKNNIMKDMFRKTIKDKECLWLMDAIVDSNQGLPIGNYTSQWFANYFLQGLDHFIKEKCGAKYYVRYVDDLVILGANKRKLHKMRIMVGEYLNGIGLTLKGNWQVSRVSKRPIDFLGFKFYYGYTTLRKKNALRIKR